MLTTSDWCIFYIIYMNISHDYPGESMSLSILIMLLSILDQDGEGRSYPWLYCCLPCWDYKQHHSQFGDLIGSSTQQTCEDNIITGGQMCQSWTDGPCHLEHHAASICLLMAHMPYHCFHANAKKILPTMIQLLGSGAYFGKTWPAGRTHWLSQKWEADSLQLAILRSYIILTGLL